MHPKKLQVIITPEENVKNEINEHKIRNRRREHKDRIKTEDVLLSITFRILLIPLLMMLASML